MSTETPPIFINYRKNDTFDVALRLADALDAHFGPASYFLDRNIKPGKVWPEEIKSAVAGARIVLVLVGRDWLNASDHNGIRKLEQEDDWVRQEIETALTAGAEVVPVRVNGAGALTAKDLRHVPTMLPLASIQAIKLSSAHWRVTFDRLANRLADAGVVAISRESTADSTRNRGVIPDTGQFVGRRLELDLIAKALPAVGTQGVVVVYGPPGVGKSAVARAYAQEHQADYANGVFEINMSYVDVPHGLTSVVAPTLGIEVSDTPDEHRYYSVLRKLGESTLLVYDNVESVDAVQRWYPARNEATHIIVTTNQLQLRSRTNVEIRLLDDETSLELVRAVAGPTVMERFGTQLIRRAGGLPVQLKPAAVQAARRLRRHKSPNDELSTQTQESFSQPWGSLSHEARTMLKATVHFALEGIREDWLGQRMPEAEGWSANTIDEALGECVDASLIESVDSGRYRIHGLVREFVRNVDHTSHLSTFKAAQRDGFTKAALDVEESAGDADRILDLMCYPLELSDWVAERSGDEFSADQAHDIGQGLQAIGLFSAAKPWFELAVNAKEHGVRGGSNNYRTLGSSQHQVGWCLSQMGSTADAKEWFERAVESHRKGDGNGGIDHRGLGQGLHQIGWCLAEEKQLNAALDAYQQAVEQKLLAIDSGHEDHDSLGKSLHNLARLLFKNGDLRAARCKYEEAVRAKEKGDANRKVDYLVVGRSLHQIGKCCLRMGKYEDAVNWSELSIEAKRRGDVHGRVDHETIGRSLHQIGACLEQQGQHAKARSYYESAADEKQLGDVYGRIDHTSIGDSLHHLGACLERQGHHDEARLYYERAVRQKSLGDVRQTVDGKGLDESESALENLRRN
ncbi:MAG: toll/interleukin-1 receptor domain-containing protein [Pseudomonadota bacterium]